MSYQDKFFQLQCKVEAANFRMNTQKLRVPTKTDLDNVIECHGIQNIQGYVNNLDQAYNEEIKLMELVYSGLPFEQCLELVGRK